MGQLDRLDSTLGLGSGYRFAAHDDPRLRLRHYRCRLSRLRARQSSERERRPAGLADRGGWSRCESFHPYASGPLEARR